MAILSMLLSDYLRNQSANAMLAAQTQRLTPHIQALMGQAPGLQYPGQDLMGQDLVGPPEMTPGAGLLQDPMDLANQLRFGAGLMEQPELAGFGSSVINQALAQSYMDRRSQQDRELQAELTRERLEQGDQQFERRYTQDEYFKGLQARRAQEAADLTLLAGKPEAGMAIGMGPDGPFHYGVPGSSPWRKATNRLENAGSSLELLDEMIGLFQKTDKQSYGKNAARLNQMYGEVLSRILQRRGYGTPQEGELARLEEELLTTEGFTKGNFKRKGTILASLNQAREFFRRALLRDRQEFRFWPGLERFYQSEFTESTYLPPELRGSVPYTGPATTQPVPRTNPLRNPLINR